MGVLGALQNGSPVRPSDEAFNIMGTKRTFCRPWRRLLLGLAVLRQAG